MEAYSDDDLAMIRAAESNPECDSKLAFEYNHGKFGGDKDALYKYRKVIKAFTDINKIGVWNWTVILGAVRKWDAKSLRKMLSTSKSFGGKAVRESASNLAQMLQDARNSKRHMKTSARTPAWLKEVIEGIELGPETTCK